MAGTILGVFGGAGVRGFVHVRIYTAVLGSRSEKQQHYEEIWITFLKRNILTRQAVPESALIRLSDYSVC